MAPLVERANSDALGHPARRAFLQGGKTARGDGALSARAAGSAGGGAAGRRAADLLREAVQEAVVMREPVAIGRVDAHDGSGSRHLELGEESVGFHHALHLLILQPRCVSPRCEVFWAQGGVRRGCKGQQQTGHGHGRRTSGASSPTTMNISTPTLMHITSAMSMSALVSVPVLTSFHVSVCAMENKTLAAMHGEGEDDAINLSRGVRSDKRPRTSRE